MKLENIKPKNGWNKKEVTQSKKNTCPKSTVETLKQGVKYIKS